MKDPLLEQMERASRGSTLVDDVNSRKKQMLQKLIDNQGSSLDDSYTKKLQTDARLLDDDGIAYVTEIPTRIDSPNEEVLMSQESNPIASLIASNKPKEKITNDIMSINDIQAPVTEKDAIDQYSDSKEATRLSNADSGKASASKRELATSASEKETPKTELEMLLDEIKKFRGSREDEMRKAMDADDRQAMISNITEGLGRALMGYQAKRNSIAPSEFNFKTAGGRNEEKLSKLQKAKLEDLLAEKQRLTPEQRMMGKYLYNIVDGKAVMDEGYKKALDADAAKDYANELAKFNATKGAERQELTTKDTDKLDDFDTTLGQISHIRSYYNPDLVGVSNKLIPDSVASIVDSGDKAALRSAVNAAQAAYKKLISGTAASDKETLNLRTIIPSLDDTPENFSRKMEAFEDGIKQAKARFLDRASKQGRNVEPFREGEASVKPQQVSGKYINEQNIKAAMAKNPKATREEIINALSNK
jgi:hypothetical protein